MIKANRAAGFFRHLRHGPAIGSAYLRNRSMVWSHESDLEGSSSSSLSDVDTYLSVVRGVLSGECDHNFRACAQYQDVLEHVSYDLALQYLQGLENWRPWRKLLESELANQFREIGSPPTYPFRTAGTSQVLNPTFIRYAHVAKDLEERFGSLATLKVGEIGVGFGGQTALSHEIAGLKDVILFDLPEVNELATWFLSKTSPNVSVKKVDGRNPLRTKVDLVVSNYAFSELNRDVQESYFQNVIQHSARGYLLWNRLSETRQGGITAESFVSRVPNARLEPESPLSFKGNVLITWSN